MYKIDDEVLDILLSGRLFTLMFYKDCIEAVFCEMECLK